MYLLQDAFSDIENSVSLLWVLFELVGFSC